MHLMFALAAYAAAEAEVFPVEAQITAFCPSLTALEIATVIPRSLKEPVGFDPSTLRNISRFVLRKDLKLSALTSGVLPSCNEITADLSMAGRYSRYRSIIPRHTITSYPLWKFTV
jgi:hypothetical protein